MESYWGSLKNELVYHRRFAARANVKRESPSTSRFSITESASRPTLAIYRLPRLCKNIMKNR